MDVRRTGQPGSVDDGMDDIPAISRRHGGNTPSGKMLHTAITVLFGLLCLAGLIWFANRAISTSKADSAVKAKQFQALFLTNGQVYFGKISQVDKSYVKVTDIYYLQVQQTVQPKDAAAAANNQQVSLAKLGGELHGPEDIMYVSRQQVLFWENLKTDGKVAKAIADYKATQK